MVKWLRIDRSFRSIIMCEHNVSFRQRMLETFKHFNIPVIVFQWTQYLHYVFCNHVQTPCSLYNCLTLHCVHYKWMQITCGEIQRATAVYTSAPLLIEICYIITSNETMKNINNIFHLHTRHKIKLYKLNKTLYVGVDL